MKKYLLFIIGLLLIPFAVNATNANISLEASDTSISNGDSVTVDVDVSSSSNLSYYEYTLNYDESKLKLVRGSDYIVDRANNNSTKKFTNSFKFRALATGTAKVTVQSYAVLDTKDNNLDVNVDPVTIRISNSSSSNNNSGSTYLSSLEIEGYSLSPKFSKTTTNYSVDIEDDISEVNVLAETEDVDATLKGNGKISVVSGTNQIKLTVTNDGEERTYTINVNLDDANPITVTIDGKTYTVVKNSSELEAPEGFEEKEITIEGQKVKALYNEKLDITLVGLRDEDGNVSLYIYNESDNSYTPYVELTFDSISFYPLSTEEELPNYSKYNITINDVDIECYKLSSDSKFAVIYGVNTETGEKGWYSYNEDENTLQKYNSEIDDYYQDKIQNTQVLIYILAGTTLLFGIIVIILAVKLNQKKSRKIKN